MNSSKVVIHKTIMEVEKAYRSAGENIKNYYRSAEGKKDIKFKKIDRKYIISQKFKNYAEDYLNILVCTHGG